MVKICPICVVGVTLPYPKVAPVSSLVNSHYTNSRQDSEGEEHAGRIRPALVHCMAVPVKVEVIVQRNVHRRYILHEMPNVQVNFARLNQTIA